MTRIASIITTAVAALVLTGGALAVDGFTSGLGCSANCIKEAIVTPTASSATVAVKTDVPASITATVTEQDVQLGLASSAQAPKHQTFPAFATSRTILFQGLEPDTAYRIVVKARDQKGRTNTRVGTFKTRKVQRAVDLPDLPFNAGAGCSAKCITKALVTKHTSQVGRVDWNIASAVPVRFQLKIYRRNAQNQIVLQRTITTSNGVKSWKPTVDGLLAGTTYLVSLGAKDAKNREHIVGGQFRTASATATVTFHKQYIIDDGETGRGEIAFGYSVGTLGSDDMTGSGGNGFHKLSSGDTVAAYGPGTSRPTVSIHTSLDGLSSLPVSVLGVECDGSIMSSCEIEALQYTSGEYDQDVYVYATAAFDLTALLEGGALPGNYGTGLPAGHDGYLVWENTSYDMKFRAYATIDVQVVS